ncbi:MAG: IS256 family transposase, partial [Treponema sp.]|nr:IS256 family transposase [Treponema sp.]
AEARGAKHPMISKSWRSRWAGVAPFFKLSPEIRKAVYTTDLKNISRKWTMPIRDWRAALNQSAIIYGEDWVPL